MMNHDVVYDSRVGTLPVNVSSSIFTSLRTMPTFTFHRPYFIYAALVSLFSSQTIAQSEILTQERFAIQSECNRLCK